MSDRAHFEDVYAKKESDKALLCDIAGEEYWIPKSQIDADSEVFEKGHRGLLITSEWWARKAGLI